MTHTINVPLATRVLDQILAAPDRWTQDVWLDRPYPVENQAPTDTVNNCNTAGCFAGWAVVLSGAKSDHRGVFVESLPAELQTTVRAAVSQRPFRDLRELGLYEVSDVAAAALGLTEDQPRVLFDSDNTLDDLYHFLNYWTGGEIAVPDELPEWADMNSGDLYDFFNPADDAG